VSPPLSANGPITLTNTLARLSVISPWPLAGSRRHGRHQWVVCHSVGTGSVTASATGFPATSRVETPIMSG
jgi:hypothetical protein